MQRLKALFKRMVEHLPHWLRAILIPIARKGYRTYLSITHGRQAGAQSYLQAFRNTSEDAIRIELASLREEIRKYHTDAQGVLQQTDQILLTFLKFNTDQVTQVREHSERAAA